MKLILSSKMTASGQKIAKTKIVQKNVCMSHSEAKG